MAAALDHGTMRQASVIARLALLEAVRLRVLWLAVAFAVLIVAAAFWLRDLHFGGAEVRFLLDLGFGVIGLGGTLLAVLGMAQLFFQDLENRSVQFVLSRPVPRGAWMAGKLGGVLAVLAVFCGFLTLVTILLARWRAGELGLALPWREVVAGGALLWLRAAVAAAATLLFCSYARSALFASGAALLFVLIGHLRALAGTWPLGWSLGGLSGLLLRLWPDLQLFTPGDVAPGQMAQVVAYGLGYVVLLAGAAGLVFQRREL